MDPGRNDGNVTQGRAAPASPAARPLPRAVCLNELNRMENRDVEKDKNHGLLLRPGPQPPDAHCRAGGLRHLPGAFLSADEGPGPGGRPLPVAGLCVLHHLYHQQGVRRGLHPDPRSVCHLHCLRNGQGGEGDRRFRGLHRLLYLPGGIRRHDQQRLHGFQRSPHRQHPGRGDYGHGRGGRYRHRTNRGVAPQ